MAPAKKQGAPKELSAKRARNRQQYSQARAVAKAESFRRAKETTAAAPTYKSEYFKELGEVIGTMLSDGATLDDISTLPGMPPLREMLRWINDTEHPFRTIYYTAKQTLIPLYEERAQTAATKVLVGRTKVRRQVLDRMGDIVTVEEEREADNVERSRLMMAAYQWTLTHLAPKKHGRLAVVSDDGPNAQLEALFRGLQQGPAE